MPQIVSAGAQNSSQVQCMSELGGKINKVYAKNNKK